MLIFCDESWKTNGDGKRVGTLAAVAIPRAAYNELEDRVFVLAEKYWGFENARNREIKGKQLLSHYEYAREAKGEVSMKLAFARELLEELRSRSIKIFASVIYSESEVDLLCAQGDQLDRPYLFLMERVHAYLVEQGAGARAAISFDDRGLTQNCQVAEAYRNFLTRSRLGRSFAGLIRTPFFAYSKYSTGIQIADVVCTVVNRYYTERTASPKIPIFYGIVRQLEWTASAENAEGYVLHGIKIIGG